MWRTKMFKTRAAMLAWVEKSGHKCQWSEIFVCNAYGVEYRRLRVIG